MKRILAITLLAAWLGGCATFNTDLAKVEAAVTIATTATVPPSTAQIAVSSFQVLEAGATEYFKYCKLNSMVAACAPGTVAAPGPLRVVIKYDRAGRNARDQIKAAGKTGALISSTVYNTLIDAVTQLTASPAASFGVPK